MKVPALPAALAGRRAVAAVAAFSLAPAIVFAATRGVGIDILAKPGGIVLGLILTLALAQLLWNGLASGVLRHAVRSISLAVLVTVAYSAAYLAMDHLVASSTTHRMATRSAFDVVILAIVALGFAGLFMLQAISGPLAKLRWVRALYVHAMNGFYIDIPARRLTARIYGVTGPVQ